MDNQRFFRLRPGAGRRSALLGDHHPDDGDGEENERVVGGSVEEPHGPVDGAMRLFNRASYYPLVLFAITVVGVMIA